MSVKIIYVQLFAGDTLVFHDHTDRIEVSGYEDPGSYLSIVEYTGANIQQLKALTEISSSCTQWISSSCRGAIITGYTWWVSANGQRMDNWGSPTGTKGCSCSTADKTG